MGEGKKLTKLDIIFIIYSIAVILISLIPEVPRFIITFEILFVIYIIVRIKYTNIHVKQKQSLNAEQKQSPKGFFKSIKSKRDTKILAIFVQNQKDIDEVMSASLQFLDKEG